MSSIVFYIMLVLFQLLMDIIGFFFLFTFFLWVSSVCTINRSSLLLIFFFF